MGTCVQSRRSSAAPLALTFLEFLLPPSLHRRDPSAEISPRRRRASSIIIPGGKSIGGCTKILSSQSPRTPSPSYTYSHIFTFSASNHDDAPAHCHRCLPVPVPSHGDSGISWYPPSDRRSVAGGLASPIDPAGAISPAPPVRPADGRHEALSAPHVHRRLFRG